MNTASITQPPVGIELRGLDKSFGDVHAVRGIDISIVPGEAVALLGPNGAGKSTTIDLLLGFSRPDRGDVAVFGRPRGEAIAAGAIGAMLQVGELVRDLSVRELLTMMASLYPTPLGVGEVLDLAGIGDVADRRTQKLSGGPTQRVRFALPLVSNPDLLVLDEPTVALDVEARRAFWATMRRFTAVGTSSSPTTWRRPTPTPTRPRGPPGPCRHRRLHGAGDGWDHLTAGPLRRHLGRDWVEIVDDGRGGGADAGNGLAGPRERMAAAGGTVRAGAHQPRAAGGCGPTYPSPVMATRVLR